MNFLSRIGIGLSLVLILVMAALAVIPQLELQEKTAENPGTRSVLYVPDTYSTIQDAIDASDHFDSIVVRDGVYKENIVLDQPVTLRSDNGSANCTIDASGSGTTVGITSDWANVTGFTIKGSGVWEGSPSDYDCGVKVGGVSNVGVTNNNVTNNRIGIFIKASSDHVSILNNTCQNNYKHGIGSYRYSSYHTLIDNTCINNGVSTSCNGIRLDGVTNCLLQYNNCSSNGNTGLELGDRGNNNNLVCDNYCHDNFNGIVLSGAFGTNSFDNNILSNTLVSNSNYAINIYQESQRNRVFNNTAVDHLSGIRSGFNCRYNRYENNTLIDCANVGIRLYGIGDNIISNNTVLTSDLCMELACANNDIIRNDLIDCDDGVATGHDNADGNLIVSNNFTNINNFAINIQHSGAAGNGIYLNNFVRCNKGGVQAADSGGSNTWDSTALSKGNYWSDHPNRYPSASHDGTVWNTAYDLLGTAGSSDAYPLLRGNGLPAAAYTPIRINGDTEFTAGNGVSSGDGSAAHPYIIENWEIDGTGVGCCIYVGNTTKHFRISNCTLTDASGNFNEYYGNSGLNLYNVRDGVIFNTTSTGSGIGLYIKNSQSMRVLYSNFTANLYQNARMDSSSQCVLGNCSVSDCDTGILVYNSPNNVFVNNTIENIDHSGIRITLTSTNNEFYSNTFLKAGFDNIGNTAVQTSQTIPQNNTANGKPIYYYKNLHMNNASVPGNAGQVILANVRYAIVNGVNCSDCNIGIGVSDCDNVVVKNSIVSNNWFGINLMHTDGSMIDENDIRNCSRGIKIYFSEYNTISNNTLNQSDYHGIDIAPSDNNMVCGNVIRTGGSGIYLGNGNGNTVDNNTVQFMNTGLEISNTNGRNHYTNNTIRNSSVEDVRTNRDITLLNCSFNSSLLNPLGGSVISVQYYHEFFFYDTATQYGWGGVANVQTGIVNATSKTVLTTTSDPDGYVRWANLTAYTYDGASFDYSMNDMTVTGQKPGYQDGVVNFNASTDNYRVDVEMADNTPPEVNDVTITPDENVSGKNPCNVQGTIFEHNPIIFGVVYARYVNTDSQYDYYNMLASFDDTDTANPPTVVQASGYRTFLNHTWDTCLEQGGYITDGPEEIYLGGHNYTNGQDEEILCFNVAYSNDTATSVDVSVEFYASNGTFYGIYIEDDSRFYLPHEADPSGKIRGVFENFRFDKNTKDLIDSVVGYTEEEFGILNISVKPDKRVPSGNYTTVIFCGDRGDNFWGGWNFFTVDNTPPENIQLTASPLYGTNTVKGQYFITATTSSIDAEKAVFYRSDDGVDWTQVRLDDTPYNGFSQMFGSVSDPDWTGYYKVVMFDPWNNSDESGVVMIEVDNTRPILELSPEHMGTFLRGTVTFQATTPSDDVQWCVFDFSSDGLVWTQMQNDTDGSDGWTFDMDTTVFEDGYGYFKATMSDEALHFNSSSYHIYFDNTAPNVTGIEPGADRWLAIGTYNVRAMVSEINMDRVVFYTSTDNTTWMWIKDDTEMSDGYRFNLTVGQDTPLGAGGRIYIKTVARDKAGNNHTLVDSLRFDRVKPAVMLLAPGDKAVFDIGTEVKITANASDMDSGLDHIKVFNGNDSIVFYDTQNKPVSFTWNTSWLTPGEYIINATTTDNVGLENYTVITVRFREPLTPDHTAPFVKETSPLNGSANVPLDTDIVITFSERIDLGGSNEIFSTSPSVLFDVSWGANATVLTIDFRENLSYDSTYLITLNENITDMAGNGMSSPYTLTFTTEEEEVPDEDTDGDGMDDSWEMENFGDLSQGPGDDYDNDGHTNLEEYTAGTDPTDPGDPPEEADDDDDGMGTGLMIGIIVVIAIVLLVIGVAVYMLVVRKGGEEEEEE